MLRSVPQPHTPWSSGQPGTTRWVLCTVSSDHTLAASIAVGRRLVVGRGSSADLVVQDTAVSRRHFQLEATAEGLAIRDLGSSGGTRVNGARVRTAEVVAGDEVTAGSTRFQVLELQALVAPIEHGALEVIFYDDGQVRGRRVLDEPVVVGRDAASDLRIDDPKVSRKHLEIRPAASGAVIVDLGAANGVEVNGRAVQGRQTVSTGDRIQLPEPMQTLVIESTSVRPRPIAIEVGEHDDPHASAVEVDARLEATVSEVARHVTAYLGAELPPGGGVTLYRPDDGVVLHPENRWLDAGVMRGDRLVVLELDVGLPSEPESARFGPSTVALSQFPRSARPPDRERVRTPRPPESRSLRGRGISWQLMGGAGIVVAGLLIALIRPQFALFALVGGLVGIISISAGILAEQSRRKQAVRRFHEQLQELDAHLSATCRRQAEQLNDAAPSPSVIAGWIENRERRLWERRPSDPDFLRLRIGCGRSSALLDTDGESAPNDSPHARELQEVIERHRHLDDVAILSPGPADARVVGLVGPRKDVLQVASWLVIQAAALHAPAELEIAVPAINRDWLWTRWLPHVERGGEVEVTWAERDATQLTRRLRTRLEESSEIGSTGSAGPKRFVVVPHGGLEVMSDLLGTEWSGATLFLVLADDAGSLPSRVDAVIEIAGDGTILQGPWEAQGADHLHLDHMDPIEAGRLARHLGRYVDGRMPPPVASSQLGLLELLGIGGPSEVDLTTLWSSAPTEPLSAIVGTTLEQEPVSLGFRSDGVHGVVGGTTGSGKSEFLQTLLVSLALRHRPDQLAFFLIDFKGGATFAELARLPHVVGVVTDLEQHATLASRAFTALEAEMARRKRLLDHARVPSLIEYERLTEAVNEPIPALLVVIDEFALLVQQQPDAKERLDLVATQGRSLGVHLLLATQSPSNVISPAIRSNTHVWVSLRVAGDAESMELLGRRDAARIPPDRPGRAFIRLGGAGSIVGFQTARISRPSGESATQASISLRPFADEAPERSPVEQSEPAPRQGRITTELQEVCERIDEQSRHLGVRTPRPLWLDPLPEVIAAPSNDAGLVHGPGQLRASMGMVDDPSQQRQEPWSVDLGQAGNLLVVGARGSGKTSTLRQLVHDLAQRFSAHELHLYGVESGAGSLRPLDRLPHCGAIVAAGDHERLHRVFARLARSIDARRAALTTSGTGDFATWRRSLAVPEPFIVLLIDDYATFKEVADASGLGLLNEQLLSLAQGGPAVGVHLAVAASQANDLRINLTNLFGARILHRQVDVVDYALLDLRLRAHEVPPGNPGRALVEGGYEVQVFQAPDVARPATEHDGHGPVRIEHLPTEVSLEDVTREDGRRHRMPALGRGGIEYDTVRLDLDRIEQHLLIIGEGRSGRSTSLLTLFESLRGTDPEGRFVVLSPRPGPLRTLANQQQVAAVASSPEDIVEAVSSLGQPNPATTYLLIDDAESLPASAGEPLEQVLRNGAQLGVRAFVAGRTADVARSFDGWARYLLSLRAGLLLMPGVDAGAAFDLRLPATQVPMTPGRGYLCQRDEVVLIQVAKPTLDVER